MSTLFCLSNELLIRVGDYLGDKDLSHLLQTNRFLSELLPPSMLKRALQDQLPRVVTISPLTWAIEYGHLGLVKTIVSQPEFSRYSGEITGALHLAAKLGHCEIMETLLSVGYGVHERFGGNTPIHCSAMNGHPAAVKFLLDKNADIKAINDDGMTPFCEAIWSPTKIFEKHRKTNPGVLTNGEEVELKFAIETRVVATLRVLVENGAFNEIFAIDGRGATPLHYTVEEGFFSNHDIRVGTAVLRFLIEQGANVFIRDNDQFTPIELAVQFDIHNNAALNFFLDLGISPNFKSASGLSLLRDCLYADLRTLPTIELLLARGAATDDIDMLCFFYNDYPDLDCFEKIVILLLIHGAKFGSDAAACFTLAAIHGSLDVMKVVFETGGVDINTTVEGEQNVKTTALEVAIQRENVDMLEFLVANSVEMAEGQQVQVEQILGKALEPKKTAILRRA